MSKITVTTIAGLTSGGDANKVKIDPTNTFHVPGHAAVGADIVAGTRALSIAGATDGGGSEILNCFNSSLASKFSVRDDGLTSVTNNAVVGGTLGVTGVTSLSGQPSFQAKSNVANINLTTYANTTVALTTVFNNEFFDIGGHYNTTNSTFTAPVAGRYYFYVQLQLSGSPTTSDHSWGINLHFQVNSAGNHANGYQSLSTNQGGGSTTLFGSYGLAVKENILNLAANDTVRVAISGNANINAGTIETVTNDGRCRFGGHFLG